MITLHRYYDESAMRFEHRKQRSEARDKARTVFPLVYKPRLWIVGKDPDTGEDITEDFGGYKNHPQYESRYFLELRKIRARRFAKVNDYSNCSIDVYI